MRKNLVVISLLAILLVIIAGCSEKTVEDANKASAEEKTSTGETNFPQRAIEMIAGGGAGGGTDTFSRAVARELSEILNENVNVLNHPGAAGAVASQEMANVPADGYTIMPTTSDFQLNIAQGKTPNYLEQFSALALIHIDTFSLMVKSDGEIKDVDTLIEMAKKNPGKITIGGTAAGGTDQMTVEKFEKEAGIDLNYIAYEDAGQMHSALLGGHVDLLLEEPGPALSMLEAGEFEMLLLFADEVEEYPDIPTSVDKGWDITGGSTRGFMIRSDVPEEIKKIYEDALKEAVESERYKEFAKSQHLHLRDGWLNASDYQAFLEKEVEELTALQK